MVLPAVLIMKTGTALILLGIDTANQSVKVLDPTIEPGAPQVLSIKAVSADYTGYTFLVRAAAEANARAVAAGDLPRNHWFWSVVKVHWRSYGHIALAASLINMLALAMPLFTMSVYDRVIPNGAIPSLVALSIGMGIAIVFDFVLRSRAQPHDRRDRQDDRRRAGGQYFRARDGGEDGAAAGLGRHPRQSAARLRLGARVLHLRQRRVGNRSALRACCSSPCCSSIAGPLAWIPLVMLPIMIAIGFIMQRPLDRAMKRLQAESAARHGVLVESLSGLETVRATGAEARMQTAWERSVAATARSGEDVHFWSSLTLTSANAAQQITSLSAGHHRRLSHPRRQALGRRPGRRQHAGGPRAGADRRHCLGHHARYPNPVVAQVDRPHHVAGARAVAASAPTSPERSMKDASASRTSASAYPNAPGKALDKVSFKIEGGETHRHHRPRRLGQDDGRASLARFL